MNVLILGMSAAFSCFVLCDFVYNYDANKM